MRIPAGARVYAKKYNAELATLFQQMSRCYRYLGNEHRFRALAYAGVARTLNNLKEDIAVHATSIDSLDKIKGIGTSIASKIMEYIATGKIQTFETLKKKVPLDLLDLLDVNGFGPATIRTLHEKLHINNREDLAKIIVSGDLQGLKGFGKKKIENLKRGMKLYKEGHARMLYRDAYMIGHTILEKILDIRGIQKVSLAGSLRRKKETIGDIDIVATAEKKDWKGIIAQVIKFEGVKRALVKGETKASIILKNNNTQVDIRLVNDDEYGAALLYFTGSREHAIALRSLAKEKSLKLNEYGVFDLKTGRRLASETEQDIYKLLGLQYIPPELREDRGELEKAKKRSLPKLVEAADIAGDMQMHSNWSDGTEDIEAITRYVLREYPHYTYIVITDHSPAMRIAGGLQPGDFMKQFAEIDAINRKLNKPFVKKGVEVDILADGTIDLPNDVLMQFDWVTASIHNGFKSNNTDRLLKACEHPYVHCIGHPGGRLIGKREAYPLFWDKLFDKAWKTGTAIEINAQPERLDLCDVLVKQAIDTGVKIVINTDAHSLDQFSFMAMGVDVARRGWCTKENVLNTAAWNQVEAFKTRKRGKMKRPYRFLQVDHSHIYN